MLKQMRIVEEKEDWRRKKTKIRLATAGRGSKQCPK